MYWRYNENQPTLYRRYNEKRYNDSRTLKNKPTLCRHCLYVYIYKYMYTERERCRTLTQHRRAPYVFLCFESNDELLGSLRFLRLGVLGWLLPSWIWDSCGEHFCFRGMDFNTPGLTFWVFHVALGWSWGPRSTSWRNKCKNHLTNQQFWDLNWEPSGTHFGTVAS